MGIGPMTFSLRERRSATELNRLPIFISSYIFSYHFLILERFHGVGAAYKILVLGTPVRFWVEPLFCLLCLYTFFIIYFRFYFFTSRIKKLEATMGIGPMTFSLRERRSATELNRLLVCLFFSSLCCCFIFLSSFYISVRFHGVGAAYKILVLGTPVRFWVEPLFCLLCLYTFYY